MSPAISKENIMAEVTMADLATKGQGTATTVLSAITTGLLALGNGNGLGGLFGGNNQQLNSLMMENSVLKAAQDTDKKLVEVYTELRKQDKQQDANVAAINVQLANMNAANAALVVQVNSLQAVLSSITKCVVPNSSVCPGWGNVTITPAASTSSSGT